MRCPACADVVLDKAGNCRTCGGVWLDEALVEQRAARSLEYTGGAYSERHCPACDEKMDEPLIYDVPIDRCPAHGMWFDKEELEEVLKRSRSEGWPRTPEPSPADSLNMLIDAVRIWRRTP